MPFQTKARHAAIFGVIAVPMLAAVLASASAHAELPPADPHNIVSVLTENDFFAHTDRDYTAGIRLGWTSPNVNAKGENFLPDALTRFGDSIWGTARHRLMFDVSNSIFTPENTELRVPDRKDRPYAGVLQGTLLMLSDTTTTRSILGVSLGVLGPSARSEDIQNGWHDVIRTSESQGWRYQVRDMPIVQVMAGRTWRYALTPNPGVGIDIDMLPAVIAAAGTLRDYAQASLQFRIGQGLDSDFGTTRMRPGLSGSDGYTPTRDFVWYFFAGVDGQAIAWDATLDGNPFHTGRHVSRQPFVGEIEGGFGMIYRGVRLTYTHVAQTQEFYGQHGGLFQFGSVAAAVRF